MNCTVPQRIRILEIYLETGCSVLDTIEKLEETEDFVAPSENQIELIYAVFLRYGSVHDEYMLASDSEDEGEEEEEEKEEENDDDKDGAEKQDFLGKNPNVQQTESEVADR